MLAVVVVVRRFVASKQLGLEQNTEKTMKTQDSIKVRSTSIINNEHPEWGTFGVMEDCGLYYEIRGNSGSRILSKTEANSFWSVV